MASRPIVHYKNQPIILHIHICFIALVISKHIELGTESSVRKFVDELKKLVDVEILNKITNKTVTIKAELSQKMTAIITKLVAPH